MGAETAVDRSRFAPLGVPVLLPSVPVPHDHEGGYDGRTR